MVLKGSFLQKTEGLSIYLSATQKGSENGKRAVKGRKLMTKEVHAGFSVILEARNISFSLRSCLSKRK